jgi:hypothetical protein
VNPATWPRPAPKRRAEDALAEIMPTDLTLLDVPRALEAPPEVGMGGIGRTHARGLVQHYPPGQGTPAVCGTQRGVHAQAASMMRMIVSSTSRATA